MNTKVLSNKYTSSISIHYNNICNINFNEITLRIILRTFIFINDYEYFK